MNYPKRPDPGRALRVVRSAPADATGYRPYVATGGTFEDLPGVLLGGAKAMFVDPLVTAAGHAMTDIKSRLPGAGRKITHALTPSDVTNTALSIPDLLGAAAVVGLGGAVRAGASRMAKKEAAAQAAEEGAEAARRRAGQARAPWWQRDPVIPPPRALHHEDPLWGAIKQLDDKLGAMLGEFKRAPDGQIYRIQGQGLPVPETIPLPPGVAGRFPVPGSGKALNQFAREAEQFRQNAIASGADELDIAAQYDESIDLLKRTFLDEFDNPEIHSFPRINGYEDFSELDRDLIKVLAEDLRRRGLNPIGR